MRPLSAKHFKETIPELEGWVDREKLMSIQGRSRKEQFELAAELDVKNYPCPAGGCLLTDPSFVGKVRDVFDHSEELNLRDFRLLKLGRHFRIGDRTKVILGRNEAENQLLETSVQPGEATLRWSGGPSPLAAVMGESSDELIARAGQLLLRYTKSEAGAEEKLAVFRDGNESEMSTVNSLDEAAVESLRL